MSLNRPLSNRRTMMSPGSKSRAIALARVGVCRVVCARFRPVGAAPSARRSWPSRAFSAAYAFLWPNKSATATRTGAMFACLASVKDPGAMTDEAALEARDELGPPWQAGDCGLVRRA
jgi:hypothetical protein